MSIDARDTGLLDAILTISGDLDLELVLDRIVEAARTLTGAHYGALGVLQHPDRVRSGRRLKDFHTAGMDADTYARIGDLPCGRGVLGVLIDDPRVLRIPDLAQHPASVGFPAHHPTMGSFLGVPVRIGDTVFGNLYLTDKQSGEEFTSDDEQTVIGLAAAAGIALDHARLFAEAERRQRWLAAAARAVAELGGDLDRLPGQVAAVAADAGGCANVAVHLPTAADGGMSTSGPTGFDVNGAVGPAAEALLGSTVERHEHRDAEPPAVLGNVPGAVCRLWFAVGERPIGFLALQRDTAEWSAAEQDAVRAFADHVALGVQHAHDEQDRHQLAVFSDRDRIARDLHDQVIQRIFAVGLSLQSLARRIPEVATRTRLDAAIADLDATIAEIRTTIFSLHHTDAAEPRSLRADLFAVIEDATSVLGFEPEVALSGPIDEAVPLSLHEDVLATLRESLSNVTRHARARRAYVLVGVDPDVKTLTVQVEDDGVGIDPSSAPGGGLVNTQARAAAAGGELTVRRSEPGTTFAWVVPLPD